MIDPRAQGSISLSSARPVAKKDVLFAFESALKASNLALLRDPIGYRIVPNGDGLAGGVDRADSSEGVEAGYGVTVVPVQFVAADTLIKLMDGFSSKSGSVRSDPSGRMLLIVGTGVERQAAVETIRTFDVDWLRGQSVGIYPIHNSSPDAMIAELEKVRTRATAAWATTWSSSRRWAARTRCSSSLRVPNCCARREGGLRGSTTPRSAAPRSRSIDCATATRSRSPSC